VAPLNSGVVDLQGLKELLHTYPGYWESVEEQSVNRQNREVLTGILLGGVIAGAVDIADAALLDCKWRRLRRSHILRHELHRGTAIGMEIRTAFYFRKVR
jgi:hypothetical protein